MDIGFLWWVEGRFLCDYEGGIIRGKWSSFGTVMKQINHWNFFFEKNKQTILHIYIGFSVCKQRTKELTVYMVSKSKIGCIIWVTISISSNLQYKNF